MYYATGYIYRNWCAEKDDFCTAPESKWLQFLDTRNDEDRLQSKGEMIGHRKKKPIGKLNNKSAVCDRRVLLCEGGSHPRSNS